MISIEKTSGRKYIAGIFKTNKKAFEHFSVISNKEEFNFVEYADFSFPFYVIEKDNIFVYFNNKETVIEWLKNITVVPHDEEFEYGTLYIFDKEYLTDDLNKDNMGVLDHIHIDNSNINDFNKII